MVSSARQAAALSWHYGWAQQMCAVKPSGFHTTLDVMRGCGAMTHRLVNNQTF